MSGRNIKFIEIFQKLNLSQMCLFIGVGRGGGGQAPPPPIIWEGGGGNITFSFNFYV